MIEHLVVQQQEAGEVVLAFNLRILSPEERKKHRDLKEMIAVDWGVQVN